MDYSQELALAIALMVAGFAALVVVAVAYALFWPVGVIRTAAVIAALLAYAFRSGR